MRVACIGLLPYPTRFWASALIAKPHVLMADNNTIVGLFVRVR